MSSAFRMARFLCRPARYPRALRCLLVAPAAAWLAACLPMIPLPSGAEPEPYAEDVLDWLDQPGITRERVQERFGPAPVSRLGGRLLIYAAARDKGMRLLLIAPPFIPATIADEQFYYLFLEFDREGALQRHELVTDPGAASATSAFKCDSAGYCLAGEAWKGAGVFPLWWSSDRIEENRHTLVTASQQETAQALALAPPQQGCALYVVPRVVAYAGIKGTGRSSRDVYYHLDDQQRRIPVELYGPSKDVFSRWLVAAGNHTLHVTRGNSDPVRDFDLVCSPGEMLLYELGNLPVFFLAKPKVTLVRMSPEQARQALWGRSLLLLD